MCNWVKIRIFDDRSIYLCACKENEYKAEWENNASDRLDGERRKEEEEKEETSSKSSSVNEHEMLVIAPTSVVPFIFSLVNTSTICQHFEVSFEVEGGEEGTPQFFFLFYLFVEQRGPKTNECIWYWIFIFSSDQSTFGYAWLLITRQKKKTTDEAKKETSELTRRSWTQFCWHGFPVRRGKFLSYLFFVLFRRRTNVVR